MRPRLKEEIAFEPEVECGPRPRPFLKWAGGKRQLLDELLRHVPASYGQYFEPFLGGGALYFELKPPIATVSDTNLFLTAAYKAVRDDVDGVIRFLKYHEARHSKAHYYAARASFINPTDGRPVGSLTSCAARLIYMNRTCFNGLWRVNKKNEFNVPMGKYENPTICDAPNLRACARALKQTKIFHYDFEEAVAEAEKGDFAYFDPPYAPVSATSNFVGYSKDGFSQADQSRLAAVARRLKARGVKVLLSNSDTQVIRDLYKRGFELRRVEARRAINSKATKRGNVGELLIW